MMNCPECDKPVVDFLNHVSHCPVNPERLASIGLITLEELNIINSNSRKGDAPTSPSPKQQ